MSVTVSAKEVIVLSGFGCFSTGLLKKLPDKFT